MPGYAEFLDVESSVKLLNNLDPGATDDAASWQPLVEPAEKLDQNADALVAATQGRSQEPKAKELKEITEQLARAISRAADGSADAGGVASTLAALHGLPGLLQEFDEERLQRS